MHSFPALHRRDQGGPQKSMGTDSTLTDHKEAREITDEPYLHQVLKVSLTRDRAMLILCILFWYDGIRMTLCVCALPPPNQKPLVIIRKTSDKCQLRTFCKTYDQCSSKCHSPIMGMCVCVCVCVCARARIHSFFGHFAIQQKLDQCYKSTIV